MAKLQEEEKILIQSFTGSIGDNNKWKEFILKVRPGIRIHSEHVDINFRSIFQVFRKKIKRAKRKDPGDVAIEGEKGEEEEEEEEDTDSDDLRYSTQHIFTK